jgi:isopenicillin N synthase-like dioxygenase
MLASVEHRAVTNSVMVRMSVASLIRPKMDYRVGPAQEMLNEETNPPKYRDFTCNEFTEAYEAAVGNREAVLDFFKIHHTPKRTKVKEHAQIHDF